MYKISAFQGLLGVLGVVMIWKQRYNQSGSRRKQAFAEEVFSFKRSCARMAMATGTAGLWGFCAPRLIFSQRFCEEFHSHRTESPPNYHQVLFHPSKNLSFLKLAPHQPTKPTKPGAAAAREDDAPTVRLGSCRILATALRHSVGTAMGNVAEVGFG